MKEITPISKAKPPKKYHLNSPKRRGSIRRNLAAINGFACAVRLGEWSSTVYKSNKPFPLFYTDTRFYNSYQARYANEQPTAWETLGHYEQMLVFAYGIITLPGPRNWWLFTSHLDELKLDRLRDEESPPTFLGNELRRTFQRRGLEVDYVIKLEKDLRHHKPHVHGLIRVQSDDRDFVRKSLNVAMGEWVDQEGKSFQTDVRNNGGKRAAWARYMTKYPATTRRFLREEDISTRQVISASNKVRSHSRVLWNEVHEFAKHELKRKLA